MINSDVSMGCYKVGKYWRLCVERLEDDWFCIHIDHNIKRMCSANDFPEEVKEKFVMLEASLKKYPINSYPWDNKRSLPEEFDDIGWVQLKQNKLYVILIDQSVVDKLKGERSDT